ncbi:MAG: RHS repeat-associated core domain-containing protein [Myxococcota bacterium]
MGESGTDGARDYIWVAGELIGVVDDAGAAYHLTTDHLGSPRRAFDASSELAWGVDMEAFGRAHPRADAIQIPIRFPGQYEDTETGLHYNWNRFYSPATGRYLTEDPLVSEVPGFGESVYGYARNNPTVYTDPDGRCPICIAARIIVAEAIADLLVVGGTAAGVVAGTQVIDHYMNESRGDGGSCSESGSGTNAPAKPDARKGKLVPNKSLDAGEGLSSADAVAEVAAGGDVIAKDRKTARDIAKQAGGGAPIHELPGDRAGPSGKPHYHPATPDGDRLPGHVFY